MASRYQPVAIDIFITRSQVEGGRSWFRVSLTGSGENCPSWIIYNCKISLEHRHDVWTRSIAVIPFDAKRCWCKCECELNVAFWVCRPDLGSHHVEQPCIGRGEESRLNFVMPSSRKML